MSDSAMTVALVYRAVLSKWRYAAIALVVMLPCAAFGQQSSAGGRPIAPGAGWP